MNNNPIYHLRQAIKYCLHSYLSDDIKIAVNFVDETFIIKVECLDEQKIDVKNAFNNCWILKQLKTPKILKI